MTRIFIFVGLIGVLMFPSFAFAQKKGERLSVEQTQALFSNMTHMTYSKGHGTQVEYLGRNGDAYLLYPGNKVVLRGKWRVAHSSNRMPVAICFAYGANTYNPVTKHSGGGFECMDAVLYARGIVDKAKRDVLGLSKSHKAPFILSKKKSTLADLRQ